MADVCHLNLAAEFRGGERQTELLIRALAKHGLQQRLVIKRGNSLKDRCADVADLDIREVAPNPIAAGMAVHGSKVAHAHDGRTVYSVLYSNLAYRIPYVITRRVVATQSSKWARSLAYKRASAVAAVSQAAAYVLQVQQPEVQPVIVPDAVSDFPVDSGEVERIRAARPGKTLIGHIGALVQSHKGQSTIIDVARNVVDSRPDWHFLLCGDGQDEERFRTEMGDLPNIELVGWVDNVGDYLSAFDLFVYPSLHEALGSTILDAMQFGLPVVASNVGGIPDFVEDGVNGRLVEPDRPERFEAALAEVLGDAEQLRVMSRRNIEAVQRFSAEQMAEAYLTLYSLPGAGSAPG
ncbi:MAG: glycosyltransferase family 4 protein [Pseudomonadota bacterium]